METIIDKFNAHLNFNDNLAALSFYQVQNIIGKQVFNDYYLNGVDHIIIPAELTLAQNGYDSFYDLIVELIDKYCADSPELQDSDLVSNIVDWLYYDNNNRMIEILAGLIIAHHTHLGVDYKYRTDRVLEKMITRLYSHYKLDPAVCKPFKPWQKIDKYLHDYVNFAEIVNDNDFGGIQDRYRADILSSLSQYGCNNLPIEKWINQLTLLKGMTTRKPRKYDMVITTNFEDMLTCSEGVDWSSCLHHNGCNNTNTLVFASMPNVAMVGLVECGTYKQGESRWKRRSFVQAEPKQDGSFIIAESYPTWDSVFIEAIKDWFRYFIEIGENDRDWSSSNSFLWMLDVVSSDEVYNNYVEYIQPFYYMSTDYGVDTFSLKITDKGRIKDYETN